MTCPGSYDAMLPPGTGLSKAIMSRATGVFAKQRKGIL
jgi:hypothetical protein